MEQAIEIKRQQLVADGDDFNTIDAFRLIDKAGRGEIEAL